MIDSKAWLRELVSEVRTIANTDELRRLWSGTDPRSVSSFAEEVAHVFDDYDIEGFISKGPRASGLTSEQFDALRRFSNEFASYLESLASTDLAALDYQEVLADPRWARVTDLAGGFVATFDDKRE